MRTKFDYFIVLAEMRTGSNFLERNINKFEHLHSFGEAFNPHFIGYPNTSDILDVSLKEREQDPNALLAKIKNYKDALGGFRFFNDHDPRVLDVALGDLRCAKIILTRNPLESYISRKTAAATGQWKLTDAKFKRSEMVTFDAEEFQAHLNELQEFQVKVLNALQWTGQTAFYLAYEDLQNVDVMNGLAVFLGQSDQLKTLDKKLKKQNPAPLSERVSNYQDLLQTVRDIDTFALGRAPNFEPRRGPAVPGYIATENAPLIYLPTVTAVTASAKQWLAAIENTSQDQLLTNFTQKTLRHWKKSHPGHRSFTILQHPVRRVHDSFCRHILRTGSGSFPEIRKTLRGSYRLALPAGDPGSGYEIDQHRQLFLDFLDFLKSNLAGQTSIRVDQSWATQAEILQGLARFQTPDLVLREDALADGLAFLASSVGRSCPVFEAPDEIGPFLLKDIYDKDIESAVKATYRKDYVTFGFSSFSKI